MAEEPPCKITMEEETAANKGESERKVIATLDMGTTSVRCIMYYSDGSMMPPQQKQVGILYLVWNSSNDQIYNRPRG